jgi:hypothetical protein
MENVQTEEGKLVKTVRVYFLGILGSLVLAAAPFVAACDHVVIGTLSLKTVCPTEARLLAIIGVVGLSV